MGTKVLCRLDIMDDLPLGSQLWNISKDNWLLSDLALFSVKEDQVPPICKTLSDKFPIHNFVVAKNTIRDGGSSALYTVNTAFTI